MARFGTKELRYEQDMLLNKTKKNLVLDLNLESGKTPEQIFSENANNLLRKRFGQFFTPQPISDLMAKWVLEKEPRTVLDPAAGTGIFARSLDKIATKGLSVDCYEIDSNIISYFDIKNFNHIRPRIINKDFLLTETIRKYDGLIMNPPYIRHHDILYNFDIHKKISEISEISISKLSNIYCLFTLKACSMLAKNSRGAVIIPTEWANSNFGVSFKEFLLNKAGLQKIIYFSNCSEIFEDALTTACVLLFDKSFENSELEIIYVKSARAAEIPDNLISIAKKYESKKIAKSDLHHSTKWNFVFENNVAYNMDGLTPLSTFGHSRRGIATGANRYFHINSEAARNLNISGHSLKKCVGKAADIKSLVFSERDFDDLVSCGKNCFLLDFDPENLSDHDMNYIIKGENENLHNRYLLSKRKPWFSMEKRKVAPVWAAVFGRKSLRFIYNDAKVYNLTTFHGFYPNTEDQDLIKALVFCLNSSIIQQRAQENRRVYGGGLYKFEPKDLLQIMVPDLLYVSRKTIKKLSDSLNKNISEDEINRLIYQSIEEATANKASPSKSTSPPTGLTKAS